MIELVIVTGVYGAGKTSAAQAFEEAGFFVTDNVPLSVVDTYFKEIENNPEKYPRVCLTVDNEIAMQTLKLAKNHRDFAVKFFGITCEAGVLNTRYRLSRKIHPKQAKGMSLEQAILNDIESVKKMTDYFDVYLDTSKLPKNEFRNKIYEAFVGDERKFMVSFFSFGYKIAVPQDLETVFDVRLLPNPYWVPELKAKTGLDEEVKDYVLNAPQTKEWLKHVIAYLDYYLNELRKNDRHHASIGIACSGGQHRSVVIAEYLAEYYSKEFYTSVNHKDITKK